MNESFAGSTTSSEKRAISIGSAKRKLTSTSSGTRCTRGSATSSSPIAATGTTSRTAWLLSEPSSGRSERYEVKKPTATQAAISPTIRRSEKRIVRSGCARLVRLAKLDICSLQHEPAAALHEQEDGE